MFALFTIIKYYYVIRVYGVTIELDWFTPIELIA